MEDSEHFAKIGTRYIGGTERMFGLEHVDRRHHLYVIGQTGTGKTTLLRNLIIQDIEAGHGVGVIDPHGDLANDLLDYIPRRRIEDVAFLNPADMEFPVGFNLLGSVSPDGRHLVASGIVSVFKSIWPDSWGPRLEYILYAAVAALLDCENVSLLGVQRMLSDARYRAWVVKQIKDPVVRTFWVSEFENYDRKFSLEAIAPIQNKVGQMLMSPHLRNILGQARSRIDARFMMDRGRIFIADMSKGKLGADKSNLMGALLVTQFQLGAMSRADVAEGERKDFFLYVDEFQSFASDSFVSILSEARKYRLCLTLSHQYIDQVRPEIQKAVFGNAGSLVSFRVGKRDAEVLEQEFGNSIVSKQFVELGNHEVCAKMLSGGEYGGAFTGTTLAPIKQSHGRREGVIRRSREKYSAKREVVEEKIRRWLGSM
ncbi:MAG: type IV secretion system DNA-binding domain-containing protein [Nitrososphaera sp.]|nr:type IV secretion system DNA-binding domain-containing protein [Nitrososphaera sp.]